MAFPERYENVQAIPSSVEPEFRVFVVNLDKFKEDELFGAWIDLPNSQENIDYLLGEVLGVNTWADIQRYAIYDVGCNSLEFNLADLQDIAGLNALACAVHLAKGSAPHSPEISQAILEHHDRVAPLEAANLVAMMSERNLAEFDLGDFAGDPADLSLEERLGRTEAEHRWDEDEVSIADRLSGFNVEGFFDYERFGKSISSDFYLSEHGFISRDRVEELDWRNIDVYSEYRRWEKKADALTRPGRFENRDLSDLDRNLPNWEKVSENHYINRFSTIRHGDDGFYYTRDFVQHIKHDPHMQSYSMWTQRDGEDLGELPYSFPDLYSAVQRAFVSKAHLESPIIKAAADYLDGRSLAKLYGVADFEQYARSIERQASLPAALVDANPLLPNEIATRDRELAYELWHHKSLHPTSLSAFPDGDKYSELFIHHLDDLRDFDFEEHDIPNIRAGILKDSNDWVIDVVDLPAREQIPAIRCNDFDSVLTGVDQMTERVYAVWNRELALRQQESIQQPARAKSVEELAARGAAKAEAHNASLAGENIDQAHPKR